MSRKCIWCERPGADVVMKLQRESGKTDTLLCHTGCKEHVVDVIRKAHRLANGETKDFILKDHTVS